MGSGLPRQHSWPFSVRFNKEFIRKRDLGSAGHIPRHFHWDLIYYIYPYISLYLPLYILMAISPLFQNFPSKIIPPNYKSIQNAFQIFVQHVSWKRRPQIILSEIAILSINIFIVLFMMISWFTGRHLSYSLLRNKLW